MRNKLGAVIGDSTVKINGDITCHNYTIIGAEVNGNIEAPGDATIVIQGHVIGNIKTLGRIEVLSNAVIEGDIRCKTIIADEGCVIHGRLMTVDDEKETETYVYH